MPIQRFGRRFQIVGRAANAYQMQLLGSPFRCRTFPGGDNYQQIPDRPVLLKMDLSTIQFLSCRPDPSLRLSTVGKPSGVETETTETAFYAEFMAFTSATPNSADITPAQASIDLDILGERISASRRQYKADDPSGLGDPSSQTLTTNKPFSIRAISDRLTRRFEGSVTLPRS